ncbi:probable basic-leucine zipper transcription factor K isoform X2 [Diorhabda carinulata]|nr:probable basic-leucine zipper transcription factor K isoform X2 [Diorhabda carinulata]
MLHKPPQGLYQKHPPMAVRGPPVRQRPGNHIPILVANTHNNIKMPSNGLSHQLALSLPQRPVTNPVRNIWKNPINSINLQPDIAFKVPVPVPPTEKPFRSAPSVPNPEFDYHVQTNQIPTQHINPIKQIGEKGPIHTIPAPNLSLRDKPSIVEEVRNDINYQHQNYANNNHGTHVTIQKSHEYQVTEPPEQNQKLHRAQQEHQKQIQLQIQKQIQQMQQQNAQLELQNQRQQTQIDLQNQQQQIVINSDPVSIHQSLDENPQGDIILNSNLSPQELYQLVNANYPHFNFQKTTSPSKNPLFQVNADFLEQFPKDSAHIASDKITFQPEYQSFNYDEQSHQKSLANKDMTNYNEENDKGISSRNSVDPLDEADLVNYFDARTDIAENKVEQDNKSSTKDGLEEKLMEATLYSSLPNKEVAERLAQLQTAGKINSNLMKLSTTKQISNAPLTIVMSDEYETEEETIKGRRKEESEANLHDYDDIERNISSEEVNSEYGHRIKPKKRAE